MRLDAPESRIENVPARGGMNELKPDCKLRRFPRSMSLHLSFETQISEFYFFLQNRYKIFIDHFCLLCTFQKIFSFEILETGCDKILNFGYG